MGLTALRYWTRRWTHPRDARTIRRRLDNLKVSNRPCSKAFLRRVLLSLGGLYRVSAAGGATCPPTPGHPNKEAE